MELKSYLTKSKRNSKGMLKHGFEAGAGHNPLNSENEITLFQTLFFPQKCL
jgi:hypothetical protein